jgi:acyl-CoA dehydrogenase
VITGVFWFLLFLLGALTLAYRRVSLEIATIAYGGALLAYTWLGSASLAWLIALWLVLAGMVLLNIDAVRVRFIRRPFLRIYRRMLPSMSQTERTRSMPARCGGTASCSPADPTGRSCCPRRRRA